MPRGPRLDAPGVLHHGMARGIDRQPIFLDDRDRDDFVRRVAALTSSGKVLVYAWALVPNHVHLLVRTADGWILVSELPHGREALHLMSGSSASPSFSSRSFGSSTRQRPLRASTGRSRWSPCSPRSVAISRSRARPSGVADACQPCRGHAKGPPISLGGVLRAQRSAISTIDRRPPRVGLPGGSTGRAHVHSVATDAQSHPVRPRKPQRPRLLSVQKNKKPGG